MALAFRVLARNCFNTYNLTQPVRCSIQKLRPIRILASGKSYQNDVNEQLFHVKPIKPLLVSYRNYTAKCPCPNDCKPPEEETKPPEEKKGLLTRLKEMYRDYWYVVVPVHLATSAIWFGSFYYSVRSGVDVIAILESMGVSGEIVSKLKNSGAGYFALTFALYKLATPLRYAVTLGGTTYAIKKLTAIGFIKPVPSKERIKEMIQKKKGNIQYQMKEKSSQVMDEMRRYKADMRNIKSKVKKT